MNALDLCKYSHSEFCVTNVCSGTQEAGRVAILSVPLELNYSSNCQCPPTLRLLTQVVIRKNESKHELTS